MQRNYQVLEKLGKDIDVFPSSFIDIEFWLILSKNYLVNSDIYIYISRVRVAQKILSSVWVAGTRWGLVTIKISKSTEGIKIFVLGKSIEMKAKFPRQDLKGTPDTQNAWVNAME